MFSGILFQMILINILNIVFSCQTSTTLYSQNTLEYCVINILTYKLDKYQPFYLDSNNDFLYPDKQGNLKICQCTTIKMSCVGGWTNIPNAPDTINPTCIRGDLFSYEGNSYTFRQLSCDKWPKFSTRLNGNCYNNEATLVQVGYEVNVPPLTFLPVYTSCHSENLCHNYYVSYVIAPLPSQTGVDRPDFQTGQYFRGCNITNAYVVRNEQTTLARILNDSVMAEGLISLDLGLGKYLAKGRVHF